MLGIFLGSAPGAHAFPEIHGFLDARGGVGLNGGAGSQFVSGAELAYRLNPRFAVQATYETVPFDVTTGALNPPTLPISTRYFGMGVLFYFQGALEGLHMGVDLDQARTLDSGNSNLYVNYAASVMYGYDDELAEGFSLGTSLRYFFATAAGNGGNLMTLTGVFKFSLY